MNKWLERGLLLFVLLVAAVLRLTGLDWDDYHHYHPDERYITWVATTIERPSSLATALDSTQSPLNPFYWPPDAESKGIVVLQDEARKFAYGHVPLYLGVMATRLTEWLGPRFTPILPADWLLVRDVLNGGQTIEFRHLTAVSRALTAVTDVATVFVIFLMGRRLYNTAVGLLAAAFLAINVMHIQLAHFFTSDPFLTFFVVAAIYCMVVTIQQGGVASLTGAEAQGRNHPRTPAPLLPLIFSAIFVGLAIGSKFAAIMLILPLTLVVWLRFGERWIKWWATAVAIIFLTFALTNPFALLDNNCQVITPAVKLGPLEVPALNWRNCYLENITTQSGMVRGVGDQAFTRQYSGTIPYLYFIEMQLRWGMGLLLGIVAFAGFGWAVWHVIREPLSVIRNRSTDYRLRITNHPSLIPLAWVIPYFLVTGSFFVKFMRYLQPMTPFLMIYGAALLWQLRGKWKWGGITAVLLPTSLYALAFVNMYSQPHPWLSASQWVFANIEPDTVLLSEQWDDALPSTMLIDGEMRRREAYVDVPLTWHTGTEELDNEAKLQRNLARLAEAEYLTVLSNRVYGVDPRLPERYPIASQYHQLLFDGSLGYEPVYIANRAPHLFGLSIIPDTFGWPDVQPPVLVTEALAATPNISFGRADESFIVYDQPLTMIFKNVRGLTADQMRQQFD